MTKTIVFLKLRLTYPCFKIVIIDSFKFVPIDFQQACDIVSLGETASVVFFSERIIQCVGLSLQRCIFFRI